jgi:hypothetical protein
VAQSRSHGGPAATAAQQQAECTYAHGVSTIQGPRDDMEDDSCVLWDAESGSLYAGARAAGSAPRGRAAARRGARHA